MTRQSTAARKVQRRIAGDVELVERAAGELGLDLDEALRIEAVVKAAHAGATPTPMPAPLGDPAPSRAAAAAALRRHRPTP